MFANLFSVSIRLHWHIILSMWRVCTHTLQLKCTNKCYLYMRLVEQITNALLYFIQGSLYLDLTLVYMRCHYCYLLALPVLSVSCSGVIIQVSLCTCGLVCLTMYGAGGPFTCNMGSIGWHQSPIVLYYL